MKRKRDEENQESSKKRKVSHDDDMVPQIPNISDEDDDGLVKRTICNTCNGNEVRIEDEEIANDADDERDEEKSELSRFNYKNAKKIINQFIEDNFNKKEYKELGFNKYCKKLFELFDLKSIEDDDAGNKSTKRGLCRVFKNHLKKYSMSHIDKKKRKKKKKQQNYSMTYSQNCEHLKDFKLINLNIDNMLQSLKKSYKKNPFLCEISLNIKSVK